MKMYGKTRLIMKKLLKEIYKHKTSPVFLVIGFTACIQALNTIILGRILSKEDFGLYSLLFTTVVPLVVFIVLLGQNTSVVRNFSKHNFAYFQWKQYFKKMSAIFCAFVFMLVFIVYVFYKLSVVYCIYLCIAIFSSVILFFIASFLRSRKKFVISILLERISPPIFLIFIGLFLMHNLIEIKSVIVFKTLSYFLPFLICVYLFFKMKKNGAMKINKSIYSDGFLLWGTGLTLLAIDRVDNLFIAKLIDYEAVAVYSILFTFVQIYDFAVQALWSVYAQKFSSQNKPNPLSFLPKIGIVALIISVFYLISGKPLLHFLFSGKYDDGIYLLIPFCLVGCLKLMYVYPACYLVGKSSQETLKRFLNWNILGVAAKIGLLAILIRYFDLLGVLLSSIVAWIYRNIVGYYLIVKDKKMQNKAKI